MCDAPMQRRGAIDFFAAQQHCDVDEVDGGIPFVEQNGRRWGMPLRHR